MSVRTTEGHYEHSNPNGQVQSKCPLGVQTFDVVH